jgi:hypothetical protein
MAASAWPSVLRLVSGSTAASRARLAAEWRPSCSLITGSRGQAVGADVHEHRAAVVQHIVPAQPPSSSWVTMGVRIEPMPSTSTSTVSPGCR